MSTIQSARRIWSAEEDEQLRLLVSYWGDQCGKNGNWDKISANFEHRSAKDCRKRWFHSLDPKLKRGRWSDAEDKVLIDAFARLGPSWQRISQLIPGRTDDQCSKRYNDVLDPSAAERLREWDSQEDAKLMELIDQYGTKWREICRHMDGRTGLTCRNRWRKLKKIQEIKEESARQQSLEADTPKPRVIPPVPHAAHAPHAALPLAGTTQSLVPHSNTDISYTISYDDPSRYEAAEASSKQYPVGDHELSRILEFCRETNQRIVIHQHIYNHAPPPPPPQQQQSQSLAPIHAPNAPTGNMLANRMNTGMELGSPQPEELFMGGSFANMDYLAFNPS